MMVEQVAFHGTPEEVADLLAAITRNCTCEYTAEGVRLNSCAGHDMLVNDQRALNGLVFERRRLAARRVA